MRHDLGVDQREGRRRRGAKPTSMRGALWRLIAVACHKCANLFWRLNSGKLVHYRDSPLPTDKAEGDMFPVSIDAKGEAGEGISQQVCKVRFTPLVRSL